MAIHRLILKHTKSKPYFTAKHNLLVYCEPCQKNIKLNPASAKSNLESHENAEKHQSRLLIWNRNKLKQKTIAETTQHGPNAFYQAMTKLFVKMNIPFKRMNHPEWKQFCLEFCERTAPDESTCRHYYLEPLYEKEMELTRQIVENCWIYLQVDEAQFYDRKIVSILVGPLNGEQPRSRMLHLVELRDPPNTSNISQAIDEALRILWRDKPNYDKFRLLLSDQASYMICVGKHFKQMYPDLLHITCLCHALHRVCLTVQEKYKRVAELILTFKAVFVKMQRRLLIQARANRTMPSWPVATRWGTWIQFAAFLVDIYDEIMDVIPIIKPDNPPGLDYLETLLNSPTLYEELYDVSKLKQLPVTIKKLEAKGLTKFEQRNLIVEQHALLPPYLKRKLDDCISKNPDYMVMFGDTIDRKYHFAPLTSVDVERSFSILKTIMTDRRTCFTDVNLRHYMISHNN